MELINEQYAVTEATGYRSVVVKVEFSGNKEYWKIIIKKIEEKRPFRNNPIFIFHINNEEKIIRYLIKGDLKNEDDFEKIDIELLEFKNINSDDIIM